LEARAFLLRASAFIDNGRLNRCSISTARSHKTGRKAVALYRLIFRNHETGATEMVEIQCDTDEQAITEARKRMNGRTVMIWHGDRWVSTFKGSSVSFVTAPLRAMRVSISWSEP